MYVCIFLFIFQKNPDGREMSRHCPAFTKNVPPTDTIVPPLTQNVPGDIGKKGQLSHPRLDLFWIFWFLVVFAINETGKKGTLGGLEAILFI